MLSEIEASQLSDIDFKTVVTRKINELSVNYKRLQGSYKEFIVNYISMKKEIEYMYKTQEEMKNTISELKNTVEGIKSSLDEADWISELGGKG